MIDAKPIARRNGFREVMRRRGGALAREANRSYAFIERNIFLTKRYWAWEAVWVTYNIVNALSITFIAPSAAEAGSKFDVNALILSLTIGTAMWSYLSAVFDGVTETITMERWEGTIEYTFMAPISRMTHLVGSCLFALFHGLALTIVQLFVISLFFHLDLSQANWGAAFLIMAVGSVSLIGLGAMSAVLPMLFTERGSQMAYIIRAIMLLVSGVYYSITVLPGFLQAIAHISPATYMLDGLRASIMHGAGIGTLAGDLWPLVLCGVVSIPLGLWIFTLAERYAKRTGKLKRNG